MRNRRNIYAAYTTNTYEKHRTSVTYMINLHSKHTWEAYMRKIHEKHVWETLWETKARDKYEKQTCEEQIWETNMRRIHQKHTWETQMTNMHGSKRNKYQNHTWETYMRSIFEWEIYIYIHTIIFLLHEEIHENHTWETYMNKDENIPSVAFSVRSILGGTLTVLPKEGCATFKLQRFSELRPFTMPQAELNGTTGTTNLFPHFLLTCQLLSELMHLSRHLKKPYMLHMLLKQVMTKIPTG